MGSVIAYNSSRIIAPGHPVGSINGSLPWILFLPSRPTRSTAGSPVIDSTADAAVAVCLRRVANKLSMVHSLPESVRTSQSLFGVHRTPHRLPNFPSLIACSGYPVFLVLFSGFSLVFRFFALYQAYLCDTAHDFRTLARARLQG